ncbi:hypothetical protein [Geopsychrobacter electrodiphilus]|uniref:hypothetical protein n=1 Tax=Geopsychrobacter electrodiphilus TaxID=225196 RepID=UPI00035D603E|nr:hypothetical protein [Geopsychrobacter electrodiphilus]
MMPWQIGIEDSSLVWQALDNGQVREVSSGTGSESQVIPDVSLTFAANIDLPAGLLDPETNRDRARLRLSDGTSLRFFRIEELSGSVSKAHDYPRISGRAWAGIITDWPPISYDFSADILASDMARLICTRYVDSGSGDAVGVIWLASQDPVIPGGRFLVSRSERWALLKELVDKCGAKLRVSTDGLNFEVYDHPSMSLSESVTRTYIDAQSLNYQLLRVKQPGNAVRVQGEQANYTRPQLPVILCGVYPTSITADGVSTAVAIAKVYDSNGALVQQRAIVEEAITAGSYTEIPVSGCYAVQAVWINTGTTASPTKGSRIDWSAFNSSSITVPDNGTQLFIVSYTQAEEVSFTLTDQADEILGEAQSTTGALAVSTSAALGRVIGVYRSTDSNRSGVNYYTGGSATPNTTSITLGITPGPIGTAVIIDYETYNGSPLSASISPASVLCDANGMAQATIGSGTTVGTAKIIARALSQEGSTWLSLLGSAVASIDLASDKAQILVGSSIVGQTQVAETNLVVHSDTYADGTIGFDGYVVVANAVAGSVAISSILTVKYITRKVVSGENRVYLRVTGAGQYFTFGSTTIDINYNTTADISNDAGTATITATVTQADLSPVSDGTPVVFSFYGQSNGRLSSTRSYTSGGVATTVLTAGASIGRARISAVCGSQRADISIEVVRVITDDSAIGTVSYPAGANPPGGTTDAVADSGTDGDISGKRRLICDNQPHAGVWVSLCNGQINRQTDSSGYFTFDCGVIGTNNGTATIDGEVYPFSWTITAPAV